MVDSPSGIVFLLDLHMDRRIAVSIVVGVLRFVIGQSKQFMRALLMHLHIIQTCWSNL